jgi:hypothetical protein
LQLCVARERRTGRGNGAEWKKKAVALRLPLSLLLSSGYGPLASAEEVAAVRGRVDVKVALA